MRVTFLFLRLSALMILITGATAAYADTFYELAAGVGKYNVSIHSKRGPQTIDDSEALNISIGAYRHVTDKAAWGAVFEVNHALSRDEDLPGSGRLLGFRPLNYLRYIGNNTSAELYAGAAQYEWLKTANGYYFGGSLRYEIFDNRLGLGLDAKYYQDLAYDNPETGDDIVDGWHPSLKIFYRFK